MDAGDERPVVRPEDHAAVSGRGLVLLAELAHDWGVRPLNEGGKAVWAALPRHEPFKVNERPRGHAPGRSSALGAAFGRLKGIAWSITA
ncbi:hypothetical protein GCM10009546_21820 [Actinomadura livida]|uniref:ATP-binding protein n=1 Tax=Actinomadura livida TaxID=79909 RepID=A0ABP3P9Z1_9ACTN|nr:hypothetical protein GCM10010208_03690 [Actinomadura livida]